MRKIGFGTAAIGRPQYINIKQEKSGAFDLNTFKDKGWQALEAAYQQGIRYFDTAPGYGLAEQLLIDWVNDKNDPSIEIATKWGYTYVADFDPNAIVHEVKDHGIGQLNRQWEVSTQLFPNLNTLQIHSATLDTGVLKNELVLKRLVEIKSINNILIGATTTGANQVEVIKHAMDINIDGIPLFDVFQVTYNVLDQSLANISDDLLNSGRRMVIKEALANGRLFPNINYPQHSAMYDALEALAQKYNVGVDAIALRFCVDSINPFIVLSGAVQSSQIKENLRSNSFELEKVDLNLLKSFKQDAYQYWSERKQLTWN